jgi:hypothetical protein
VEYTDEIDPDDMPPQGGEQGSSVGVPKPRMPRMPSLNAADQAGESFSLAEFKRGLKVEMEHADTVGGDMEKISEIVIDHLRENPRYYSDMEKAEFDGD